MAETGRFYVTTPIYYVNDEPHIGHAYTTVLADVMRRYKRLFGCKTLFLTGTDEHGQKVQQAANRRGVDPQRHCDELHESFRRLWPELHVEYDDFIRTTEPRHTRVVRYALQQLYDQGDIDVRDYEGWYSTAAERFWTDKDLVDGRCPDTGEPVERIQERNYFFRMSRFEQPLRDYIREHPEFIRPPHRANEVLGFLDQGLGDLCISRPKERLSWGIELPFDDRYVTYVWFDALLNYISSIGYPDERDRFETWWPHAHHLIGKDILVTHSVYWTTMLMALGLPMPRSIIATGWWLQGESKMSKSRGNVVDPLAMRNVYGTDVLRHFLTRDMVIGLDADFREELVVRRNNSDLANDLGNLARRATTLVQRHFEGRVPEPGEASDDEEPVLQQLESLKERLPTLVDELKLHETVEEVMQLVRRLNKYFSDTAPFRTVKHDRAAAARSLYTTLEGLRHAAWMLYPVMPRKMPELLDAIGASETPSTLDELRWGELEPGRPVELDRPLFPRAEMPAADEGGSAGETTGDGGEAARSSGGGEGTISFDDFQQLELRVGTVRHAEAVQGADRLLRLTVDLGEGDERPVVAGIAHDVAPEELRSSQVVVVANLPPRKIFGQESRAMLLTAPRDDGGIAPLRPSASSPPGSRIG